MTHVANEAVINWKVCPNCFKEINYNKPMTPSNFVQTNNSVLSGTEPDIKLKIKDFKMAMNNNISKEGDDTLTDNN